MGRRDNLEKSFIIYNFLLMDVIGGVNFIHLSLLSADCLLT
jgi:hypothetical protein